MASENKKHIKRRSFLKKIWVGLGILVGIELIYMIFNFLRPSKKTTTTYSSEYYEAGLLSSFEPDSITPFRSRNFFISRLKSGELLALSSRCTHLGCALECDHDKNLLVCPCHSSMFDINGHVLRSPATRNLDQLDMKIQHDKVMVNPSKLLKRKNV
jgi:nitrite reductase/ring-hydroxylating ferredoxin subunit